MGAFVNNDETLTVPPPRRSSSVLTLQDIANGVCRRNGTIAQTVMRARDRHEGAIEIFGSRSRTSLAGRTDRKLAEKHSSNGLRCADTIPIGNVSHICSVFIGHEATTIAQGMFGFRFGRPRSLGIQVAEGSQEKPERP